MNYPALKAKLDPWEMKKNRKVTETVPSMMPYHRPCFFRYRDTQKRVIAATKSPMVKIICIPISASQPVYKLLEYNFIRRNSQGRLRAAPARYPEKRFKSLFGRERRGITRYASIPGTVCLFVGFVVNLPTGGDIQKTA
jgi:hypothetical protein